jgi:hypothetical protein
LGGNQPTFLQEVECQIWGIVWEHATQMIDLRARLQEVLGNIISLVSQPENLEEDKGFGWFNINDGGSIHLTDRNNQSLTRS